MRINFTKDNIYPYPPCHPFCLTARLQPITVKIVKILLVGVQFNDRRTFEIVSRVYCMFQLGRSRAVRQNGLQGWLEDFYQITYKNQTKIGIRKDRERSEFGPCIVSSEGLTSAVLSTDCLQSKNGKCNIAVIRNSLKLRIWNLEIFWKISYLYVLCVSDNASKFRFSSDLTNFFQI